MRDADAKPSKSRAKADVKLLDEDRFAAPNDFVEELGYKYYDMSREDDTDLVIKDIVELNGEASLTLKTLSTSEHKINIFQVTLHPSNTQARAHLNEFKKNSLEKIVEWTITGSFWYVFLYTIHFPQCIVELSQFT